MSGLSIEFILEFFAGGAMKCERCKTKLENYLLEMEFSDGLRKTIDIKPSAVPPTSWLPRFVHLRA
jgi:hypothetical protein